ncbi:MAG: efflux RND transporter periplasmic adaptor subunit [bacterium]|jgi:RND family efflux transporter MFP subunit|nr:efflux RND transporter periplasmic adaptor subunit [bacterium]
MPYRVLILCTFASLVLARPLFTPAQDSLELHGFIKPYYQVDLGCGAIGVLESILVEKSQRVDKGQVLAQLDRSVEEESVKLAQARLEQTETMIALRKARMEFTQRDYARKLDLYTKDSLSLYDKDQAETNLQIAQLDLQDALKQKSVAELEVKQAKALLARRTLRSSLTGVVIDRLMAPGELVNEQPVLSLAQLHPLLVEIVAPLATWGQIKKGMKAEIFPESPVDGRYPGRIKTVDRVLDAASATYGIEVELPNEDFAIPAGIKCRVRVALDEPPAP